MLHVLERLRDRPASRQPRVVLFGESLGAQASQDMLIHWGTLGPQALGIDRALWIGTLLQQQVVRQVTGAPGPTSTPPSSRCSTTTTPSTPRCPQKIALGLRYVMIKKSRQRRRHQVRRRPSHVPPPLALPQPPPGRGGSWGQPPPRSPRDAVAKNAQVPGAYRAWAHDYRPDLARFIRDDLPASEEELVRVERALEEREAARERLVAPPPAGHDTDVGPTVSR
jgi:hypothetical protein